MSFIAPEPADPGEKIAIELVVLLKWAITGQVPDLLSIDGDELQLLEAIHRHRVAPLLFQRLRRSSPMGTSALFNEGVRILENLALSRIRIREAHLSTIVSECNLRGIVPLIIKGAAVPYLLQDMSYHRTHSSDIDIVVGDPTEMTGILAYLGYQLDSKNPPVPKGRRVQHEVAKFIGCGLQIDLHRSFPIRQSSSSLNGSVRPAQNHNKLSEQIRSRYLSFDEIERSSVNHRAGFGDFKTPSIEMSALISVAHMYGNFVSEFPRKVARVRAGELATVLFLMQQSNFNDERFRTLTRLHGCRDSVAFTKSLLHEILGREVLLPSVLQSFPTTARSIRDLWWAHGGAGFPVDLTHVETLRDTLYRTTKLGNIVESLGYLTIAVPDDETHVRQYTVSPDQLILQSSQTWQPNTISIELQVGRDYWAAGLTLSSPDFPVAEIDIVVISEKTILELIRHENGEVHLYDRRTESRDHYDRMSVEIYELDGNIHVRVSSPWDDVARAVLRDDCPALVGVRCWPGDSLADESGTCAILMPVAVVAGAPSS